MPRTPANVKNTADAKTSLIGAATRPFYTKTSQKPCRQGYRTGGIGGLGVMTIFGSGMSVASSAEKAAAEATAEARQGLGSTVPKLAVVFTSESYPDVDVTGPAIRKELGNVPIIGGTAGGCLIGPGSVGTRGVSIVLLGGDDIEVVYRAVELGSRAVFNVVDAAEEISRCSDDAAKRDLPHFTCLAFAPALSVDGIDGESLVAALRKGAGARALLAGGLTGDDKMTNRARVFRGDELRNDHVVIAGLCTRRHVGIAARHGWNPVGPTRTITRVEGTILYELDHRPAVDVWLEDARKAGATPPARLEELSLYLANNYELGLTDRRDRTNDRLGREFLTRAPLAIGKDGSIAMAGSIPEGRSACIVRGSKKDLLRASTNAASDVVLRTGSSIAGALILSCSGRFALLGDEFGEEARRIRERLGAPVGGACVYGEIAKNERDVDAFFNGTVVVVAFAV